MLSYLDTRKETSPKLRRLYQHWQENAFSRVWTSVSVCLHAWSTFSQVYIYSAKCWQCMKTYWHWGPYPTKCICLSVLTYTEVHILYILYMDLSVCLHLLYSLSANIGRSSSPFQSTVTVHWSASWPDTSKQRISSLCCTTFLAHRPSRLYSSRRSLQKVPHWEKLVASMTITSRLDYSNAATFAGVADEQIARVQTNISPEQRRRADCLVLKIETWHRFWKNLTHWLPVSKPHSIQLSQWKLSPVPFFSGYIIAPNGPIRNSLPGPTWELRHPSKISS